MLRGWMKPILIVGGLSAVVLLGLGSLIYVFLLGGGDYVYPGLRLISPDGKHTALFFGTGGGGAAGWTFQHVAIAESDDRFDPDQYALLMREVDHICLSWLDNDALLVEYPGNADILRVEKKAGGIKIRIEPLSWNSRQCRGRLADLGAAGSRWRTER